MLLLQLLITSYQHCTTMSHIELFQLIPGWEIIDCKEELLRKKIAKKKYPYPTSLKTPSLVFFVTGRDRNNNTKGHKINLRTPVKAYGEGWLQIMNFGSCCNTPWVFSCRLFTGKINGCWRQEILSNERFWLVKVARISGNMFPAHHHLHLAFSVCLVKISTPLTDSCTLSFLSKQM